MPEKLEAIATAGFDGVEIFENDLLCFDGTPTDIRKMANDLGLNIYLFQPFRDFEGVSTVRLARNLERARHKFNLMHELGADRILVCSSVAPDTSTDDALIVDQLGELAVLAHQHGITVGYEALAWGTHVRSYRHAWRVVDAVGMSSLGVVLDSFHTLALDDSLDELATIPGHRIAFVQIADAPRLAMNVIEWSRHFRCFPGQGDFPVAEFVAPILASGYQGPISLEVFNDDFRGSASKATAKDGMRSLLYLEEQAFTLLSPRSDVMIHVPSRLTGTVESRHLLTPGALSTHKGFEFLEFAVDETGQDRLGQLLTGMGFRLAGRHRSKCVLLYRQGKVNIVLNAEPDSFASEFFQMHGASLCALAFQVDNATLAFDRAVSFGYRPIPGKTGPNERVVPAVQAPDGSLVYFVDDPAAQPSIYDSDFILEQTPASDADWLNKVDHISVAIMPEAINTWVLFYRAVFGFVLEAPVTLPDPYGLIRSRAMHSVNNEVRVVLNSSENENTAIGRALSTYQGAGLHHIAIETSDLFGLAHKLSSLGTPPLAIPGNYYEDLAARFDLDADVLSRLAEMNILYDRDPSGGELFHLYFGPVEGRFFIEILERRAGYGGFGAINAPIRLAAHAQKVRAAESEALAAWG